jgi:high affinity Mn2+ porin
LFVALAHADEAPNLNRFSLHSQSTSITQEHGRASAPNYSTPSSNTLSAEEETRTSFTATLFTGAKIFNGSEIYFNPEAQAGSGLSQTHGVAGFPNGEIYRVDSPDLKFNLSRLYLKQIIDLGDERESIADDINQVATTYAVQRLTVVAGKFALNDFFDNNRYSHDPRTQFMNWSTMDNGAWDYAADTRGYSIGVMIEYNQKNFAVRFASVMEPENANQMQMDENITHARGDNLEFELRYEANSHPGKLRLLGYMNHAHMGNYNLSVAQGTPGNVDISSSREYRTKYGAGLNLEQELTSRLGFFSRLGWNDGQTETWTFTEVDATASAGLSWQAFPSREDRLGFAVIRNEISPEHRGYLSAGGTGFMIGDGGLNYAPEEIAEVYYSWQACRYFAASGDAQWIVNPGYNQDHASVAVVALRLHAEF